VRTVTQRDQSRLPQDHRVPSCAALAAAGGRLLAPEAVAAARVYSHRVGTYEVCDASPYLKSAARFHGDATEERLSHLPPENLIHVNYIYGDELKNSAGAGPFGCGVTDARDDAR